MDGQPISETVLNQDVLSRLPSVLGKCIDRSAADSSMTDDVLESNRTYARDQVLAALASDNDVVAAQSKIQAASTKSPLQEMIAVPFPRVDFLLEGMTGEAGLVQLLTSQEQVAGSMEQAQARSKLNMELSQSIGTRIAPDQMSKLEPAVRKMLSTVMSAYGVNLADTAVINFLNTTTDRFFAHPNATHELRTGFLKGVFADLGTPQFMDKVNEQFGTQSAKTEAQPRGFSLFNAVKRR